MFYKDLQKDKHMISVFSYIHKKNTEMYSHPNSYTSLHYLNSFANWKLSG